MAQKDLPKTRQVGRRRFMAPSCSEFGSWLHALVSSSGACTSPSLKRGWYLQLQPGLLDESNVCTQPAKHVPLILFLAHCSQTQRGGANLNHSYCASDLGSRLCGFLLTVTSAACVRDSGRTWASWCSSSMLGVDSSHNCSLGLLHGIEKAAASHKFPWQTAGRVQGFPGEDHFKTLWQHERDEGSTGKHPLYL